MLQGRPSPAGTTDLFRLGETLFPFLAEAGVAVSACALDTCWDDPERLHPAERAMLAGAAPVRQREIIAGRAQARALTERLGLAAAPLLRGADRRPLWPAGLVGSITHSRELCAVAAASGEIAASLGIDLEPLRPIEPELHALICTDGERRALMTRDQPLAFDELVCCVFAAKEAFYKAWHPVAGLFLEHHDVTVVLDPGLRGFTAAARMGGGGARGRLTLTHGHVAAAVVLAPGWPGVAGISGVQ
jgi:4'-phosphopantetheinyl transferase EntD